MDYWSMNGVRDYLLKRIRTVGCLPGSLQRALRRSPVATIGLEHISEHLYFKMKKRYYCDLCHISHDAFVMYNHIIGNEHRIKYLRRKNIAAPEFDVPRQRTMKIRAYAEEYEKNHGRLLTQIQIFKQPGKYIFPKAAAQKSPSQEPKNLNSIDIAKETGLYSEQPSNTNAPQFNYDSRYLQQLPESNCLDNINDQSDQGKETSMSSVEYSDERNFIVNATTPNTIGAIQDEACENTEATNYSDISDDEDAESVISISSSTSIDMGLSDMDEENYQTNENNSYDVALGAEQNDQQVTEANWNLSKMECLQQVFMEHPEPLVIETQSQWEFLVSVIQSVSETVEKCNVQNLPL